MKRMDRDRYLEHFEDEIITIRDPLDRDLEISRRMRKDPKIPLLFENVDGEDRRLVANLWSTRERIAGALGISKSIMAKTVLTAMAAPRECKVNETDPFKEGTEEVDLRTVPVPTFFQGDGGPYFTAAMVVARDEEGNRNLSYHRLMVIDRDKLVGRIVPRHLYSMYEQSEVDLDVAIFLTMEPEVMLAGAMSVSYGVDELEIASALKERTSGEPLELVRLENGLNVPASSEYVFEGRITKKRHPEGPFVDITGTYDKIREEPVFELDRMHTAEDPVFVTISPGGPDHFLMMGMPREPIILEAVEKTVPVVKSVRLSEGGCSWLHGIVSIEQQRQGDSKNAIMAAFGAHPSMKRVIVVDTDIDIFDDGEVEWALATRFQAERDLVMVPAARGSSLDNSSDDCLTSKIGMDATMPKGKEDLFLRIDD